MCNSNMPIVQECTTYGMRDLQSPLEYSVGKGGIFLIKTENVIEKIQRMAQTRQNKISSFKQLNGLGHACASSTE